MRTAASVIVSLLFVAALENRCSAAPPVGDVADNEAATPTFGADDWPWWRGANGDGIAHSDQNPPLRWSATENVLWKAPVPGRGHGSPIVVGDQVILTAADEAAGQQLVLCFERATGREVWRTTVHEGGLSTKGNKKSSQASTTAACDGERLFVTFVNNDAVSVTALDRKGRRLWQTPIDDYVIHQGYGASPALFGPLVIATADHKAGGAIAALHRATGEIVWRHDRPSIPNYTSPIILNAAGRRQLVIAGCNLVSSFDPLSGEKLWEIEGATEECVTSTVTDGDVVLTSGGYPRNHVAAIRADGSGAIAWEKPTRVYVPSMLIRDGHIYAVTDDGVALCWRSSDGEELWKGRLGGTFSSSPVLVGDRIYATNETGQTFVFAASTEKLDVLAENTLGDQVYSTPVICGSRIYVRVAEQEAGERREFLYCLGEKP